MATRKTGARKTGAARKSAAKTARTEDPAVTQAKKDHTPETRPSDSGARQPDPRSAATRATNAAPGTEIETSSGPQEVGPTRGARRPFTERLAVAPRRPVVVVPTEEEEKFAERRDRAVEKREAADKAAQEGTPTQVIALQMGWYNGKRQRAGSQFIMNVPKGADLKTFARWVEPVEEYEKQIMAAAGQQAETSESEPARRGARKTGTARKNAAKSAGESEPATKEEETEPASSRKDEDVL